MTANRSKSSTQTSNSGRPLNYQREASIVHLNALEMQRNDRQKNALLVPKAVLRPGSLPVDSQGRLGMHQMKAGERIFWKQGSKAHFSSVWLDENWTRSCHGELRRWQELMLKSPASKNLAKEGQTGGMIHLSISTKMQHRLQPHSDFLKKETNKDDPRMQEMVRLSGSVISKLFRIGLPAHMVTLLQRRSDLEVSLGAGHEDNCFTSHVQANISLLGKDLPTAIGPGGALHIDGNNDPGRLSIVIFLSHLPKDHCPGKFILPSESTYCITAPFTAIICSGHLPHWPIPPAKYEESSIRYVPAGPVPSVSEDIPFRRLSVVSYPERTAMKRAPVYVNDILLRPESLYVFGTKRNQHEFWARLQARKAADQALESGQPVDDTDVSQIIVDNVWSEDGETRFPRSNGIKEILFGDPDDDDEWQDRLNFISDYISCGYHFPGGHRNAEPILTDFDDVKNGTHKRNVNNGTNKRPIKNRTNRRPIQDANPTAELPVSSSESESDGFDAIEGLQSTSSGSDQDHFPPQSMNKLKANDLVKYLAALQAEGKGSEIEQEDESIINTKTIADESDLSAMETLNFTEPRQILETGQKRQLRSSGDVLKRRAREPFAYASRHTPRHTPKHMDFGLSNTTKTRHQILSKKTVQNKYDNRMKNLLDLVMKNAISLEDYNTQVEKLGKLKSQAQG